MLRKDKALLESLTKKYGKKNVLNTINEDAYLETHKNKKLDMIYAISETANRIQRENYSDNVLLSSGIFIPLTNIKVVRVSADGYFTMVDNDNTNRKESDWLSLAMLDDYMLKNILSMLKSMEQNDIHYTGE
jgi:hypothetical protein